ncbi:hypothetical protein NSK_007550 [Nannochloropsis salina CCMP1776]|uniref:Uncharacterized protein n=1 Tax=Nannochloropsis salina CCMP1776 TaxID=1027361 RepID=A0A4D9CS59_9STRA|nr:hypothetical protein NSK_007550 [Nannochloropsis salina CCMP1776]|eukprot:TFJ80907.1 hypothetical protein NSK_007550 [Nannochloropsis salina CCMP1776]
MIRIAACPKRFCATNKCRQRKTLSFLASPTSAVLHSSFPYTSLYSRPRQAKSSAPLPFSGFFPSTPLSSFHSNAFQAHPFPTTSHRKAASSVAEEVQEEPPSSSPFPFLPPSPHHSSLPPSSLPTYEHPDVAAWEENVRQEDIALLSGPRPREWWTGPVALPGHTCPGLLPDGSLTSLPLPHLSPSSSSTRLTRESLAAYFDNTWTLTEVLFAGLQGPEGFYQPPYHGLRHPL